MELELANVFEKMADYIEAVEEEKALVEKQARDARLSSIQEKFSAATGESFDEEVLGKLSSADPTVLETIEKLAHTTEEGLGGPSSRRSQIAPLTPNEEVKLAGDRLVNFSIGGM